MNAVLVLQILFLMSFSPPPLSLTVALRYVYLSTSFSWWWSIPGRQKTRWRDEITNFLDVTWMRKAQDRTMWCHLGETCSGLIMANDDDDNDDDYICCWFSIAVFFLFIFSPVCAAYWSSLVIFACASCRVDDKRAMSYWPRDLRRNNFWWSKFQLWVTHNFKNSQQIKKIVY